MPLKDEEKDVAAVAIKPIKFSETSASLFFKVLEAQFNLNKITANRTQFYHALSGIPVEVLENVPVTIIDCEDYEELKLSITSFYERSKSEVFDKLISATSTTGRPSVYLRELQQLAAKVGVGEELVRHKFLRSLPTTISPALSTQQTLPLAQLGSLADDLIPLDSQSNTINAVHRDNSYKEERKTRGDDSKKTMDIPYAVRPFHPDQRTKICRFHIYYGDDAKSCKPWCRYPNKRHCKIMPTSRSSSPTRQTNQEN